MVATWFWKTQLSLEAEQSLPGSWGWDDKSWDLEPSLGVCECLLEANTRDSDSTILLSNSHCIFKMMFSTQSKITKYWRRQDSVHENQEKQERVDGNRRHPAQGIHKIESSDTDLRTIMGTTELSRKQTQVTIRLLFLWINVPFREIRFKLPSLKMHKKVGK